MKYVLRASPAGNDPKNTGRIRSLDFQFPIISYSIQSIINKLVKITDFPNSYDIVNYR